MRDSAFLAADLTQDEADKIVQIIEHGSSNFVELVKLAWLNPATDLR